MIIKLSGVLSDQSNYKMISKNNFEKQLMNSIGFCSIHFFIGYFQ